MERPIKLGNLANSQEVQILVDILRDIYRRIGSSSVTAGGVDTNIQYNNAGVLGGFGSWDGSTFAPNGDLQLPSGNAVYLGDKLTNGSWRIIRSGNNLSFQRREAGVWVEKSFVAP